ncbi:hypothetical protein MASR2M15_04110 [Anaerolineales bacterium]
MKIDFDFETDGFLQEDPFLDPYEQEMLFDNTRRSITAMLERKFAGVRCDVHQEEAKFLITGVYDNDSEQMELSYHVDTCCQPFLLRVMQILNQRA